MFHTISTIYSAPKSLEWVLVRFPTLFLVFIIKIDPTIQEISDWIWFNRKCNWLMAKRDKKWTWINPRLICEVETETDAYESSELKFHIGMPSIRLLSSSPNIYTHRRINSIIFKMSIFLLHELFLWALFFHSKRGQAINDL